VPEHSHSHLKEFFDRKGKTFWAKHFSSPKNVLIW
jgi:hypothetical protein